jgi:hypothetical protein
MTMRKLTWGLVLTAAMFVAAEPGVAQSSKPGSSSSPSKPAPTPPTPSKPKFGPTEPSKPPANTKPVEPPKPAPTPPANTKPPEASKPKFGPTEPSKPPANTTVVVPVPVNSAKPKSDGELSDKARANREARSETKYAETQKATAPPKPKYTTADGKEVQVRTATKEVEYVRNLPSSAIKPEVRQQNVNVHVTNYHYRHPASWYYSQPTVYVGGGYSSPFWYMMSEWDAERRARWLYNHRYDIDKTAYERGLQDGRVAAEVARLENQRSYRDPNYIDPEFKSDPSLTLDDDYVRESYNPTVVTTDSTPTDPRAARMVFYVLGSLVLLGLLGWGIYCLCCKVRWGS